MRWLIFTLFLAPNLASAEDDNSLLRWSIVKQWEQIYSCQVYLGLWSFNFPYQTDTDTRYATQLKLQFEVDEKIYTKQNLLKMESQFYEIAKLANERTWLLIERLSEDEQNYLRLKENEIKDQYEINTDNMTGRWPTDLFELSDRIMKCAHIWDIEYN